MSSKYKESGVDIDAANRTKKRIGEHVKATWGKEVLSDVGNFGGLFALPKRFSDPVLVSSADGVGTKLKVAFLSGRHDTVGQDLVNHCVNDILVQGAEPLFFLDYFACGKLEPEVVSDVVKGLASACGENGCALIGGETAEMPGFYADGEYDLAGCIVGAVDRDGLIDGGAIAPGDAVWALPSSGLHTNGYSLARRIVFAEMGLGVEDELPGTGRTVADELLQVHRSYLPEYRELKKQIEIKGLAHITGGGLLENIPRILPPGCSVEIDVTAWDPPPVFKLFGDRGGVERAEMYRVFNMGVGMIFITSPDSEDSVAEAKCRWDPFPVGRVVEGDGEVILEI
ncbi:MAG: phosphoribosylformylglycinamidine cyclo-ligase, partial [Candidatus Krumholzibacteria bacterium]|nr:phosphoribosylformylglycinamidine cyclo-ligase [Candidatus Krumholzibacteria bacterium]